MKVNPKTVKFVLDLTAAVTAALASVIGNYYIDANRG